MATKNQGKVKEFATLFSKYGITVKSLLDFTEDTPDILETGSTFQENAKLKAETIAQELNMVVLADDSGLVVDTLGGQPGIYSARFAGEPKSDRRNNEKLLKKLTNRHHRDARFICVLAYAIPKKETILTEGYCEGYIADRPTGENGFGYDPLFIPQGYDVTMAELNSAEKNKLSHRFHALQQLEKTLQRKNII